MGCIGKLGHIGTQFGQKVLRPTRVDTIDAIETAELGRERAHLLLDVRIQLGKLVFQKLDFLQEHREHPAMMRTELAL